MMNLDAPVTKRQALLGLAAAVAPAALMAIVEDDRLAKSHARQLVGELTNVKQRITREVWQDTRLDDVLVRAETLFAILDED